jgi:hypothetical protein
MTRTTKRVVALAVALIAALFLSGAITLLVRDPAPDSGVVACQEMAANMGVSEANKGVRTPLYKTAKDKFGGSKHSDLRDAGSKLLSTMELMEREENPSLRMNLGFELMKHSEEVRVLCANHGVYIPRSAEFDS